MIGFVPSILYTGHESECVICVLPVQVEPIVSTLKKEKCYALIIISAGILRLATVDPGAKVTGVVVHTEMWTLLTERNETPLQSRFDYNLRYYHVLPYTCFEALYSCIILRRTLSEFQCIYCRLNSAYNIHGVNN